MCMFWIAGTRKVEKLRFFFYLTTTMNLINFSASTLIIH